MSPSSPASLVGRWLPEVFGLELSQRDVDFVIPRLDADLPMCIDPFLLFKSKREDLRAAHDMLMSFFGDAITAFRNGDRERTASLVLFPEVEEIRFGYARGSIRGRGMGRLFSSLFVSTLSSSPALVKRGLRHAEELQLFSPGIAQDRISDLTANVLSEFLVAYTQRQSEMWDIPLQDAVPLRHIWNTERGEWLDTYTRLPVDPATGIGILLVPRWTVRRLPWINFEDYLRTDFRSFLSARFPGEPRQIPKVRAVELTRSNLDIVDRYVDRKEGQAAAAQPDPPPLLALAADPVGDELLARLATLPSGRQHAYEYQHLMLAFLNTLFEPELIDGTEQARTASGVEIRDLTFTNNSDRPFLSFIRTNHGNMLLVCECKNKATLDPDDINQLANYLGDPLGYCGVILTRHEPGASARAKIRATYNKGTPRRVILVLYDEDFRVMLDMRRQGQRHPVDQLQRKYRELVQSIE